MITNRIICCQLVLNFHSFFRYGKFFTQQKLQKNVYYSIIGQVDNNIKSILNFENSEEYFVLQMFFISHIFVIEKVLRFSYVFKDFLR